MTMNVSRSWGQYVSAALTVEFTIDLDKSSITRYLGSCVPCCSLMQNRGDITVNVLSCCVTGDGLDNQPFLYSSIDMSQHFCLSIMSFVRDIWRRISRFRVTRSRRSLVTPIEGSVTLLVSVLEGSIFPAMFIPFNRSRGKFLSEYPRCLMRNMISGMFNFRAGVRAGRLLVSLSRCFCRLRLTLFKCRITRCLIDLTVHVFATACRIILRTRIGNAVLSTLSNGSIRVAIWRATCGVTPSGMIPGRAVPARCVVAAVAARTACRCRCLEGWKPSSICLSHFCTAWFASTPL